MTCTKLKFATIICETISIDKAGSFSLMGQRQLLKHVVHNNLFVFVFKKLKNLVRST